MDTFSTTMKGTEEETKLHIAMFPWLAFGHIFPYLELAKLIAQKGHKISFISTPRNIDRLPKLPPNLSETITFVKLPLPSVNGLPSDAEATTDLPPEKNWVLKKAHDLLREPMFQFLEKSRPDWIVYDFIGYWVSELGRSLGIGTAYFSIFIASCLGYYGVEFPTYRRTMEDFTSPPKWVPFPTTVAMRPFEFSRLANAILGDDDNVSDVLRLVSALRDSDVVAVRSCWELERNYLCLLSDLLKKPVVPVGQLPPEIPEVSGVDTDNSWQYDIKGWLEEQEKGSVVYVAFGSEAEWSEAELGEIALGLEQSGLPFLWAFRSRPDLKAHLPEGFEERVGRRGYICRSWVPQVRILAHEAVGALLNHSGWSSVVEALQFSKPLILVAFSNDQGMNLKVLEEMRIGFSIPRDETDGSFTRDAVAESLRIVVRGEEGKTYRENAKKVSSMFGDRLLQDKYVDEFLCCLNNTRPYA